jgi:predicted HicB family RNase H-like nuclease
MGGKTSNESKAKYNAKAYDRINIAVPKGRKAELQAVAGKYGQSVNSYINRLIDEAMEREKAEAGVVSVFQPLPRA